MTEQDQTQPTYSDLNPGAASDLDRRGDGEGTEKPRVGARILLVVTLCTTFYAGLVQSDGYAQYRQATSLLGFDMSAAVPAWYSFTRIIVQALAFSACLLGILFAHEMGHYLTAKKAGVRVSFPVFLPSFPPFGTFGAFIRMESRQMPANVLMRVAAWGPFAGMIVAVPVLIIGLLLSEIRPLPVDPSAVTTLGSCLLMHFFEVWLLETPAAGSDIYLHPVAFAGWAGCFVTALNLLPIGQLDGGHVTYALVGRVGAKWIALLGFILLLVGSWFYIGWAFFGLLIFFVLGWEHPPLTGGTIATGRQRILGWLALVLFVLTFAPIPIHGGGLRDLLPEIGLWIDLQSRP